MKTLILSIINLVQLMALIGCGVKTRSQGVGINQAKTRLKTLDGGSISTAELEAFIEQTMEKADVAGLSCGRNR